MIYTGSEPECQSPLTASFDHVIPKSSNGSGWIRNEVVAHRECNTRKGRAPPSDDMLERLAALNLKRADLLKEIDDSETGIGIKHLRSLAGLILFEILLDAGTTKKDGEEIRFRIDRANRCVGSLREVSSPGTRDMLWQLFYRDQLEKIEGNQFEIEIAAVLRAIWDERGDKPPRRKRRSRSERSLEAA